MKMPESLLRNVVVTLLAFAVVAIYGVVALNLKVFNPVGAVLKDYSFTDFYYRLLDGVEQKDTSRIVTIVDMTDLTSRRDLAEVLMEINALHPKAVGIDVVFEGYKEDVLGDTMIAVTARQMKNTVFSYKILDDTEGDTRHSFFLPNDTVVEGFTNMPRQLYGGLKRQLSVGREHGGVLRPSLIKQVADIYAGQEVVPLAAKELDINFSPVFFHVVPPDSVLACRDLIEDHVVLFGAMKEEADMHYTPQGKIAGVKLLAYAVETMLRQNQIRHVPEWLTVVVSLLIVFVTVVMLKWYGKIRQKKTLMRVLLSASLFKGLFLFVWLSILVWAAFILFSRYQVSINLTYALAAVAFIGMANDLYDTLKDLITFKKEKKQ